MAQQRRPLKEIRASRGPVQAQAVAKQELALTFDGFFLYGVAGEWMVRAHQIGGRAAYVGSLLWWIHGMNGRHEKSFIVQKSHREKWEISQRTFEYGLKALERASLIKVEREIGKSSKIMLII
jgi:hypothetical protein